LTIAEEKVPAKERFLVIEGKPNKWAIDRLRPGLPRTWDADAVILLASFSYADVPIGTEFTRVFPSKHPESVVLSEMPSSPN
jgi:hypothetical protein